MVLTWWGLVEKGNEGSGSSLRLLESLAPDKDCLPTNPKSFLGGLFTIPGVILDHPQSLLGHLTLGKSSH